MKERMLIVDDEPDILDFVERVFRKDYDVRRAQSGRKALEIMRREEIHILVTDHKMPGMTGLELLASMEAQIPYAGNVVKVLLSGYTDVPEIQKAVDSFGIHQYVVKPVDTKRLKQAIEEAKQHSLTDDWLFTMGTDPGFRPPV